MAVYTHLTPEEVADFLGHFGLGPPEGLIGIPAGSINTNYFVDSEGQRYFLRLSEVASAKELLYEASLLSHLSARGTPTPVLVATKDGEYFAPLKGKHASLFQFAEGVERTAESASASDLWAVGAALAQVHRAGVDFPLRRAHEFDLPIVSDWIDEIATLRRDDLRAVTDELCAERDYLITARTTELPSGVIHGDLFPDNVKFDRQGALTLVFDFEMASDGILIYDLGVSLNAWCYAEGYDWERARALIQGYGEVRAVEPRERRALYTELRLSALRFCVTRIRDFHLRPVPEGDRVEKDYRDYLYRLRALQELGADRAGSALWE